MFAPFVPEPEPSRAVRKRPEVRATERHIIDIPSGSSPLKYTGLRHVTLRGVPAGGGGGNGGGGNGGSGEAPSGERAVRDGGGSDADGLRVDNSEDVIIQDLELVGWYRGIRIGDGTDISVQNCYIHGCQQQGILTVDIHNFSGKWLTVRDITGEHAVYFSETVDGVLVEDSTLGGNTGDVALQINSEGGQHAARNCRVVNTTIQDDKAINLLGGELRLDACQVEGRINLNSAWGHADWKSHLILGEGTTHEGNLNVDGGSTVTDER
jgi:Right handed beta helix region